jgi:putative hemolysin
VLNLDERHVGAVLTPRAEVVFLDVRDTAEVNRSKLQEDPYTVLPLCDGGLDHVLGFVRSSKVLEQLLAQKPIDLPALAEPPLFVPETMTLMMLLEQFKRTHLPVALVVDEFGDVEGLVSLTDVISSIVGDLPDEPGEEPMIVQREDGSWLIDGALDIDAIRRRLDAPSLFPDREHYHTLGGFVMLALGRVPRVADVFERDGYRFEVVDMDGNRVDRVLVSAVRQPDPASKQE